jgi:hypothetical protein
VKNLARHPELCVAAGIAALTGLMSLALRLPVVLPDPTAAAFVGMHYLYPLAGLALWSMLVLIGQRDRRAWTFLLALPCYVVVLLCHFSIKLWGPHINPHLWDGLYWQVDQAMRPLVEASFVLRRAVSVIVPLDSGAYLYAFIALFYGSFGYHAIVTPTHFRKLVLAALLIQALGALCYLAMPALGPFIYEAGVEPQATAIQAHLLRVYEANVANSGAWLASEGGRNFTAGLAAMPSLHAGCTFLFLLFARRYGRVLYPIYCLLFAFILVTAIASRWHYIVDLPVGLALAWFCYWAAHRLLPEEVVEETERETGDASALPVPF